MKLIKISSTRSTTPIDYIQQHNLKHKILEWDFIMQITKGIKDIHLRYEIFKYFNCRGIVHRDIKPENIFVDKHNTLKIGDFGLARFIDSDKQDFQNLFDYKRSSSVNNMNKDSKYLQRFDIVINNFPNFVEYKFWMFNRYSYLCSTRKWRSLHYEIRYL